MNLDNLHLKYIRRLILVLTASGALNIILLSLFFYWFIKDAPPPLYFEQKPALKQEQQVPLASTKGNIELIHYFRSLSFDELVARLSNHQLIENGYTQRDIALACLVAFHHFDLSRALLGQPPLAQQRSIIYGQLKSGQPAMITVYPGLSDENFQAVIQFANTERWPLTSKGLFLQLKKFKEREDASLSDAFFMTSEFLAVEWLFNRAEMPVSKIELQNMLLDGTWGMLSGFAEQQKIVQDLSAARRQRFLLEYVDGQSKHAAYLLLKVDGEFALNKLDDYHVLALLALLEDKTSESEKYALDLLDRPRSDNVWKAAGAKLYQYAGELIPENNLPHGAMKRFILGASSAEVPLKKPIIRENPSKPLVPLSPPPPTPFNSSPKKPASQTLAPKAPKSPTSFPSDRLYIVQEGDSLWKISRRFKVDIEVLRDYNKLKTDALKPGTPLRIPS
ncbi:hypothetical protein DB41_AV00210 [Neochlamydia sp. TUME1]|uniref:LysM peptidoglycan-binding domain-containing protein n=1 Tax=Neochlamydia sp. TUME1 TaxID=1478174 RepID=UPI0005800D89|nr:LysM peptidoglycan-binding domain-containing protein [Neochlamydia sp. TUME1]KIC71581.1 hypothetical protein DB41_AV00210 [Neochlamydia sp. TUME1]